MSKSGSDSENFDEEQAVQSCSIQPYEFEPRKNSDEADSNSEGDESMASDQETSSTVCGPWTGRKRRERVFLTTEEQ